MYHNLLGHFIGRIFTDRDPGANTDECPLWQAGQAVSDALKNLGCSFLNGGMNIIWINARVI